MNTRYNIIMLYKFKLKTYKEKYNLITVNSIFHFYYVIKIVLNFFFLNGLYSHRIFVVYLGVKFKLFFQVFMYLTGTVNV